ncbi:hypothetical protein ABNF97_26820 [Plantactinospora sp. B6F1]|uniref:hypothetical protein n=1 Tax=Plantactinospora sp. B6F1 TaxID=3158971 RepID=UPI0032D8F8BE
MDAPHSPIEEIIDILEQEFACDLAGLSLEPSLSLGHDGLGLDSLMVTDLLVRWYGRHAVEPTPELFEQIDRVTIGDLLRVGSSRPQA